MEIKEKLQQAYFDHILEHGQQPSTAFVFARENGISEEEFYNNFGTFGSIEQAIWLSFFAQTIAEVKNQEVWPQYSSREKTLSFFYSFIEFLKGKRSFANYSLKNARNTFGPGKLLALLKPEFEELSAEIIQEGIESGELMDRPFLTARYKDALWVQLLFILNFWLNDTSTGFEKTDEAIEKGLNLTFDLFQRSPVDDLFDYGKFVLRNSGMRKPF